MMKAVMNMMKKIVSFLSVPVILATMTPAMANASYEEPSYDEYAEMIDEVAELVNEARVEHGLKPLYVVPYLNEVAEIRATECTIQFAHSRKDGSSFATAIDQEIVPYSFTSENIAAGSSTAAETFNQWRNSSGHWAAILNPDITHMGIGFSYDEDAEYKWYWQQTFVATDKEFGDQYLPTENEVVPTCIGDVNGDGVVDSFDYLVVADYVYKKNTDYPVYLNAAQLEAADCFRDGIITKADTKVMVRYILGEYKTLPFVF